MATRSAGLVSQDPDVSPVPGVAPPPPRLSGFDGIHLNERSFQSGITHSMRIFLLALMCSECVYVRNNIDEQPGRYQRCLKQTAGTG
jgi:hypothetical protein